MKIENWIAIIGILVVVGGWIYNGYENRKHEVFKKRLDYRLSMLTSYKDAAVVLEKLVKDNKQELADDFVIKLEKAQTNFLLYGLPEEIKLINSITQFASENKHQEMKKKSNELMNLVRKNIRNELGL